LDHPYRNPFQRDRDRVVHARAFRRLEAKTQVFTPGLSDHFRNRLTHTIEVSQIARTVSSVLGLDEDLTEALALAHDIGHPPFAHAGEDELNRQMQRFGDRFDHNLHALRIVEIFEQRYARFPGLNLTFEVREGIVKHSRDYDPAEYAALSEYLLSERPPIEAQLIDFVDEIAYNTADLDDGYEAKLLDIDSIRSGVPLFACYYEEVESRHPQGLAKLKFNEAAKRMLDHLATGLIENTRAQTAASGVQSVEDVRRRPRRLAGFSPPLAAENATLKKFLLAHLYEHPTIVSERVRSVEALGELFHHYMAHPDAMPRTYWELAQTSPSHRVVCDYIAGMTDHFLLRQHEELLGSRRAHFAG
jgi:dGTPase